MLLMNTAPAPENGDWTSLEWEPGPPTKETPQTCHGQRVVGMVSRGGRSWASFVVLRLPTGVVYHTNWNFNSVPPEKRSTQILKGLTPEFTRSKWIQAAHAMGHPEHGPQHGKIYFPTCGETTYNDAQCSVKSSSLPLIWQLQRLF
jgi:hypothetical protein